MTEELVKAGWLTPDWFKAHHWASMWVAILWGAVGGILIFLPVLGAFMSPVGFGFLCIGMSVSFALARLYNQPGT